MQEADNVGQQEAFRQNGAVGSTHGTKHGKLEAEREGSRLFGTIDTKEMKELMRRLNFTKCAPQPISSGLSC